MKSFYYKLETQEKPQVVCKTEDIFSLIFKDKELCVVSQFVKFITSPSQTQKGNFLFDEEKMRK